MNIRYLLPTLISSAILTSPYAMAENSGNYHPQNYSGWSWSANVGQLLLDKKIAEKPSLQLSEEVSTVGFAGEYFNSNSSMTYAVGINYLIFKDKNPFWIENRDGSYDESDANGFMVYAEAGPRYRIGQNDLGFVSAKLGISDVSATRDINNCRKCYSEDLDIKAGAYGVLAAGYSFSHFDLSLQYQQYFSGDFNNGLNLKISTTF